MQFSKKAEEQIESCRFCWMCHHVCPIGNATGLERNTARARALGLSLVARNAVEYSEDIISNVYECSLCGGCMKDCVTGWSPVMFTKEARLGAALDGKLPDYILKMINNINITGNIYGEKEKAIKDAIEENNDILLFAGEDTRIKGSIKNARKILDSAGVEYDYLKNEPNSGYSMDFLVGASQETKNIMKDCADILSAYKTVICYDPQDAKIFMREYKEYGVELKPEIVTFTSFVSKLINEGKLKIKKSKLKFTPQDSWLLTRELEEIQPIRNILSACGEVSEMLLYGKDTVLAGNLIMNEYMSDVMRKVSENRWKNAINMNTEILVCENPAEYILMSNTKPENIKICTVEEAVLKCL